jgi:hypothetical protein
MHEIQMWLLVVAVDIGKALKGEGEGGEIKTADQFSASAPLPTLLVSLCAD